MEKRRKLLYSDIEGNVMDIMAYIRQLEKERDDALRQVEEWNEDDAVFEARRAQEEAEDWANEVMHRVNEGFFPSEVKWKRIRSWEAIHASTWHPMPDTQEMTKYTPNAPEYRYEFKELSPLDGKCGCVTCLTCARKAMRRSLGIEWLYERFCEKYDVRCDFGEI